MAGKRSYSKREINEYKNIFRKFFYLIVTRIVYNIYFNVVYRLKVNGRDNIPTNNQFIIAPNHLSTLDPPLMGTVFPYYLSFMSKQELFEIPVMRQFLDLLGAFAVNREHLCPSTIKTAKNICKTNWVLGLFPEGSRGVVGSIGQINKGFSALAKATKCGILPVGIIGTDKTKWLPFSGQITVNIGRMIPYSDNIEEMNNAWIKSIQELTGYKYKGE